MRRLRGRRLLVVTLLVLGAGSAVTALPVDLTNSTWYATTPFDPGEIDQFPPDDSVRVDAVRNASAQR